jgi:maltose alpha-D-glucosyltransferase/alpha-amylase
MDIEEAARHLEQDVLPAYLPQQRWFADKGQEVRDVRLVDAAEVGDGEPHPYAAVFELPEIGRLYFVPFVPADGDVREGFESDQFVEAVLADIEHERKRPAVRGGVFDAHATPALRANPVSHPPRIRRMNVEQSNTSVVVDERIMLKGYRRTHPGPQPELEVARFLDRVGYRNTPQLLGFLEYERPDADSMALCIVQRFIAADGDGWKVALESLRRLMHGDPAEAQRTFAQATARARRLGLRTAELHQAFATPTGDAAFEPEPTTRADLAAWEEQARETATLALDRLAREHAALPAEVRDEADALLGRRAEIVARLVAPPLDPHVTKTRLHGDYHLGQVLVASDDFQIVDFEGEPGRPPEMRRRKASPLRDVAGMLRSFDYAALTTMREAGAADPSRLALAREWQRRASAAFLAGYREAIVGCSSYPTDPGDAQALLDLFVLEKAFYEVSYELANRPGWLGIPIEGIRTIIDRPT